MRRVPSACPLDCPDTCSLTVDVGRVGADGEEDCSDGEEQVLGLDGSDLNPYTAGFICGKVSVFRRHMYGEHRLRYPMVRDGAKGAGTFRRVSWDEALDLIVTKLRATISEHGAEAILPYTYGGSNGYLTHDSVDSRLFRRLGASRLLRTVCAAPTGAALKGLYGNMAGVALEDYRHAKLIVLWGVNPSATSIHLVPVIREAQESGAKLIVVDPRQTPLAKGADLHLGLRPGTDLPVALALIHELFTSGAADDAFLAAHALRADELRRRASAWSLAKAAEIAGVDEADLARFAELYRDTNPAVIRCGWGQERNRNGGGASAAILALPAVAGKFGVRGGGYTQSNGGIWGIPRDAAARASEPDTRAINMNLLGQVLAPDATAGESPVLSGPPIKFLFVYNNNPLATTPNQEAVRAGLMRDDLFTVVSEQVMTDTARHADVLLPATTFLEHRELRRSYGVMRMFDSEAAVAPVGESRPNYELFAALIERLGLAEPGDPTTPDELVAAVVERSSEPDRVRRALVERGMAEPPVGATPVQFVDIFPGTPDGKIDLVPAALDREAPGGFYHYTDDPATAAYPLALISPSLGATISSTFSQNLKSPVVVEIHPHDADARGIADGALVRVYNQYGEVHCPAKHSTAMRPGVVFLPKGMWCGQFDNGATANALAPDTLSDVGGGACFNDARVEIEVRR